MNQQQAQAQTKAVPTVEQINAALAMYISRLLFMFKQQQLTNADVRALGNILSALRLGEKDPAKRQSELDIAKLILDEATKLHEEYKIELLHASVDSAISN